MDYEQDSLSNLLDSLEFLYSALRLPSTSRHRQYVRQEHAPFLETRFRIFDEYLVTRRPEGFLEFIKLLPDEFENLYERLGSGLEHPRTHAGPITGRHRLMIYLRFVTQRRSFRAYALDIGMGKTTVSSVVEEVTEAIIRVLHHQAFPRLTRTKLEQVAARAQEIFDYPRTVGFMDGKHIRIEKPAHSGSAYWNYKHYHSIVLLAISDCDRRIMAYDIGAPGHAGDAGVFRTSVIKGATNDRIDLRIVVPTFPVLMTSIALHPDRIKRLVISMVILHNLLPRREDQLEGVRRYGPAPNSYHPLRRDLASIRGSGSIARDRMTQYYVDQYGHAKED